MDHSPRLTPRAKGAQIAPDGPSPIVVGQDEPTIPLSSRVAPLESSLKGSSNETEYLVKYSGRAALKDNASLYLKMLLSMGIASLYMFAMFAVISWAVPNYLCEELAMELSGSAVGIKGCVYVSEGGYSPYSGSKVFWLIFWSVQLAWVAMFPGFICKALFGSCMSRLQEIGAVFIGACIAATTLVTALVYDMALDNLYVVAASAFGSLTVVVICGTAAIRFTGNNLMKWRFIFLFSVAGQVNTFYIFVMPLLITLQSQNALGGMGLTIVRLFVHPAIWTVVLFFFRTVQRHLGEVKDLTTTCFIVWPILYSSLYGRFLLLQLENVGSVVILNFMFACFHIAGMLNDRGGDHWWLSLLYGERAKDAMQATRVVDEIELVNQLAGSMCEAASIVAASALLSFGGVATSPGVPPDNQLIWFNAAVQLATTLIFNFIEIAACGKFHNIEWRKVYPKSTFRFLSYVLVVLTFGGSRLCVELLLLFCPKYYDEYGILMEQCDKPSLFQAISLTLSQNDKWGQGMASRWIDAEYANGTWISTS